MQILILTKYYYITMP